MPEPIRILHLYPHDMNIYGDHGNVLALRRRLEWRGYDAEVVSYDPGLEFPDAVDLVVGGGGQDSGQVRIEEDLVRIAPRLRGLAADGVPMLVVCGMYQLFGRSFTTTDGRVIRGAEVLDVDTVAAPRRLIGNVVAHSDDFGRIVGFENHSGMTTLGPDARPLATVQVGGGNDPVSRTEGARSDNVIGTYLHGSLLPRNPRIADHLIAAALHRRFGPTSLEPLDDSAAELAGSLSARRPR